MYTRRPAVSAAFALLFVLACGESPNAPPTWGPALEIVAGAGLSDTIQATPSQGLIVQVRGPSGQPEIGATVVFDAETLPCTRSGYYIPCSGTRLAPTLDFPFAQTATTTTDEHGRAVVRLRLGTLAGPGLVRITVPAYQLADSVPFTVRPGGPFDVFAWQRDTTLDLGGTFAPRAGVVDYAGNLRSDPVTFEATSPAVQVSRTGSVAAAAIGRAYVRVRGTVDNGIVRFTGTDSIGITVVPQARLAVVLSGLTLESLAGGNVRQLKAASAAWAPGGGVYGPMWSPTGEDITYFTSSGSGGWALAIADTLGHATPLATPGLTSASEPEYSRDGLWIYFQGENGHGPQIFRVHPDGTGLEALQAPGEQGRLPSPSPDGTRFAYAGANDELLVRTIATGHVDTLATTGFAGVRLTRWSPDGNWIAFVDTGSGAIGLIRPDGSGLRSIRHDGVPPLTWSPDSRWLVACVPSAGLALVDITTGALYPLTTGGFMPAWRP